MWSQGVGLEIPSNLGYSVISNSCNARSVLSDVDLMQGAGCHLLGKFAMTWLSLLKDEAETN